MNGVRVHPLLPTSTTDCCPRLHTAAYCCLLLSTANHCCYCGSSMLATATVFCNPGATRLCYLPSTVCYSLLLPSAAVYNSTLLPHFCQLLQDSAIVSHTQIE